MATTTHVGDTRALVFPVMCDGHLKIEYDDYNSDDLAGSNTIDESKHPLWDYGGPFSIEAIITPYDVNGIGHRTSGQGRLDSTKTPPSPNLSLDDQADTTSNYQSVSYFGANRGTHKMMLFANSYLKFYLQNTTSSNFNQPAEYKLVVEITDSVGTPITHTIDTDAPVFVSKKTMHGYYDANNPSFYNGISTSLKEVSTSATAAFDQASIQVTGDLTSFTNTAGTAVSLGTATITVNNQPTTTNGSLDTSGSITNANAATGSLDFDVDGALSGFNAFTAETSSAVESAVDDNNIVIYNDGTTNSDTFRFVSVNSSNMPSGASNGDLINSYLDSGVGMILGAAYSRVYIVETGSNAATNASNFISAINAVGSTLRITASQLTAGPDVNLAADLGGTAYNNTIVIGSDLSSDGVTGSGMSGGTNSSTTNGTSINEFITISMGDSSGSSLVTKRFKFFPSSQVLNGTTVNHSTGQLTTSAANGQTANGTDVVKVVVGANATASANALATAINHSNGFGSGTASHNGSGVVTITSPNTHATNNQTNQTLTRTSEYTSDNIVSFGANPFDNFSAATSNTIPTAFITLTDSAGNTVRYKPSKGDLSETTGSTGTENGGVTYFLVDASNNDTTAANLRSAILNNSSGHAQFSPAISASISSNTITLTATAASGSHALASTGISSGLSLTNFTGGSANTFTVGSGEADDIGAGNGIYDNSGTLIGTVSSVSGNNITLSAAYATTLTSTIYTEQNREALYLEQIAKVGMSFNKNTISLFINNQLVKRAKVNIGKFRLNANDCYIGQDGSLNAANRKATQFMGELYEIAFHKSSEPCLTKSTLTPNYSDTLFYYSFGD